MSGSIASLGMILKTCNRDDPRKQEGVASSGSDRLRFHDQTIAWYRMTSSFIRAVEDRRCQGALAPGWDPRLRPREEATWPCGSISATVPRCGEVTN